MNVFRGATLSLLIGIALTQPADSKGITPPNLENSVSAGDSLTSIKFIQPFEIDSDNVVESPSLYSFSNEVDSIMRVDTIQHVSITGIASVDGPVYLNNRLAAARAKAMENWLTKTTSVPENIITTSSIGEDWGMFRQLVEKDPAIPSQATVIQIIDSNASVVNKERQLRNLDNGLTWQYLAEQVFPVMRCAIVDLDVKHRFIVAIPEEILEEETIEMVEVEVPEPEVIEETPVLITEGEEVWRRRFYIKTDLPYWLMTWSNLAFEVDLAPHWSFNLPIYYSAVNYFRNDIKFRTFSFQPGFRYWFKPTNTGIYLEAHYGMGWWDFAFGGDYRYQDHFRRSPTMGGGVAAGYRLPISSNGRWAMEFGGGVGVYRLHYDRFFNRPNGKLIDTRKKTVFFIDNVNVSISYSFPIEKKKGGGK